MELLSSRQSFFRASGFFRETLGIAEEIPDTGYLENFLEIAKHINLPLDIGDDNLRMCLIKTCIRKLEILSVQEKGILHIIKKNGILANYHDKVFLYEAMSELNVSKIEDRFSINLPFDIIESMNPHTILEKSILTIEKDPRKMDIYQSMLSEFLFYVLGERNVHLYNTEMTEYNNNYYEFLEVKNPELLHRSEAAAIMFFEDQEVFDINRNGKINKILDEIWEDLDNYGYLAVVLKSKSSGDIWSVYSKLCIHAERFRQPEDEPGYFHAELIEKESREVIGDNLKRGVLSKAFTGFMYKDTFIIRNSSNYNEIVVIFKKQSRDESKVPCPACRTLDIRGNSYPSLGIKSWECNGLLCPDKSKYNRGKRYSMEALRKQRSIEDPLSQITYDFKKKWMLDCVDNVSKYDIVEMLIRNYSIYGDRVKIFSSRSEKFDGLGRNIIYQDLKGLIVGDEIIKSDPVDGFLSVFSSIRESYQSEEPKEVIFASGLVVNYESEAYLSNKNLCFEGAITSPPYYNDREYANWKNIYTYLFDMYNNIVKVYQNIAHDGIYAYNVFDTFDNDKTHAMSAMGDRRLILGAYAIYMLESAGFEIENNLIWFKGHVEGTRHKSGGNLSPYYQAPLNSWEHVIIARKGKAVLSEGLVMDIQPVKKMFAGKNHHGHSAPFPIDIPDIIIKMFNLNNVLDPYAGSMTTALAAIENNIEFLMLERDSTYFDLGVKKISELESALTLRE